MKQSNGIVNRDGYDRNDFFTQCPLVDGLVISYLTLTAGVYVYDLFLHARHLSGLLMHGICIGVILGVRTFLHRQPPHRYRWLRLLHAWYPPAALPFIYEELAVLNRIVWDRYFDPIVWAWERRIFAQSPVMWFSEVFNHILVSEYLHFSYTFYYFMIIILAYVLYHGRRYREFQSYLWTLLMTFFFCYFWFIFFPVEGPRYSFPSLAEHLQHGPFYRLSHWILKGAARGAAFPSSHVAAAVVTLMCAWKWDRKVFIGLFPLGIGLVLGTVYGRFHYGIDALAGLVVAAIFYIIGPRSFEMFALHFCPDHRSSKRNSLAP